MCATVDGKGSPGPVDNVEWELFDFVESSKMDFHPGNVGVVCQNSAISMMLSCGVFIV
jgi:hypothetical protein